MSTPNRGIVTLFDLLALIAATAVGLALMRVSNDERIQVRLLATSTRELIWNRITAGQIYVSCFLAPWSLALLALNLRATRTSVQQAERGPGFMACVAATSGVALYVALCSAQLAIRKLLISPGAVFRITTTVGNYAALMVAGAWLSLVLDSRWRSETDWIGWAGRIVGASYIGVFLIGWLKVVL